VKPALDQDPEPDAEVGAVGEEDLSRLDLLFQVRKEPSRLLLDEARVSGSCLPQGVAPGQRRVYRLATDRKEISLFGELPVVVERVRQEELVARGHERGAHALPLPQLLEDGLSPAPAGLHEAELGD